MSTVYTEEQIQTILAKLSAPFSLSDIRWRVIERSQDRKNGKLHPYADPRVYDMRLNDVLTPAGWSCSFLTSFAAGLTRPNSKGVTIPTGKIAVNATVTIHGISTRDATGEGWADDNNAMCVAEAQAFKRACSKFGVGRYFYALGVFYQQAAESKSRDFNPWVPLDGRGRPTRLPKLPDWAIPGGASDKQPTVPADVTSISSGASRPGSANTQSSSGVDQQKLFTQRKESYRAALGDTLYRDVISRVQAIQKADATTDDTCALALSKLEKTNALLEKVIASMVDLSEPEFRSIMDPLTLVNLRAFPSVAELQRVAARLQVAARQAA